MTTQQKIINWVFGIVLVIGFFVIIGLSSSKSTGAGFVETFPTRFVNGINVGKEGYVTKVFDEFADLIARAGTFSGLVKTDAGTLRSYTNSTSTADTTQTVNLADIYMYDTIAMTPTVGATTLTYAASSTFASLVPTALDSADQCWINASSTEAITLTFAAGTGWDFDIAATSTTLTGSDIALYAVPPLGKACVEYTRMPATATTFDIKATWKFYTK
jgi:hypothetical protein